MQSFAAFIDTLTTGHCIAIVAILVGIFFGSFTVANYIGARRERNAKTHETTPEVKATINKDYYAGGWRSVQLHVAAPPEQKNFKVDNWRITTACLLKPPWPVALSRAQNDDYAQGVFNPDDPVRALNGKVDGRPQRFALEFFINFRREDDRGRRAKFRVTIVRLNKPRTHTLKVWATVPADAATAQRLPENV